MIKKYRIIQVMDVGLNISVNITMGEFECSLHEVENKEM